MFWPRGVQSLKKPTTEDFNRPLPSASLASPASLDALLTMTFFCHPASGWTALWQVLVKSFPADFRCILEIISEYQPCWFIQVVRRWRSWLALKYPFFGRLPVWNGNFGLVRNG